MRAIWISILLTPATLLVAQHNYTPADIEDGARLYRASCGSCHGANGDLVAGITLGQNKFKHATTDDQLIQIVRTGIAGTAMPPGNFTEFQAGTIVAYLHSMAVTGNASTSGDAPRGKALFEGKGGCATCHRVRGSGSRFGPELTDIGALRRPAELERSMVEPDADIQGTNHYLRLTTKDGTTTTGRILNEDTFGFQLLDSKERLVSFAKSNLKDYNFLDKSPMPSMQGKLSQQEIGDIVAYLITLKGIDNQ